MNGEENRYVTFSFPHGEKLSKGDRTSGVSVLQIMLDALSIYYDSFGQIPVLGVFDDRTEDAVREVQRANLLPVTGEADDETLERIIEEYRVLGSISS